MDSKKKRAHVPPLIGMKFARGSQLDSESRESEHCCTASPNRGFSHAASFVLAEKLAFMETGKIGGG